MGATAFQKSLGGMHALAHPIGALYDTHHGMTNATLMPYVLKFNRSAIDERITRLAAYLQLANPGFDSFLDLVLQLRADTGVPHSLAELGVDDSKTALIAQMAVVDPSAGGNPLPLTEENVAKLFTEALHGRL
jgi:alcohol dehydrogenase